MKKWSTSKNNWVIFLFYRPSDLLTSESENIEEAELIISKKNNLEASVTENQEKNSTVMQSLKSSISVYDSELNNFQLKNEFQRTGKQSGEKEQE